MAHRRSVLFASASMLAVGAVAAPAFAQQAAGNQPTEVQEVVVTGIRASLQKAISIKKNSDDIVDAISAEDIGKLPDRNVADALMRIPGVNTQSAASGEGGFDENDRVSVRGTPSSLTQVTVDGHSVSTGDWFILDQFQTVGRSVSFTLLPSEIVNNLVVDKSQNASLVEGGVAGSIDIQTRSPLDFSKPITVEASAEGAYNSLSGTTKPQVSALLGWKNADDTFGVMLQGFYEQRDVRRYGQETLGWGTIGSNMQTGMSIPGLVGDAYPTLIGSALFEQQRTREGGDFVAQWRPNDQWEFKFDAFYSDLNATNRNYNYMFDGSREFSMNAPTSYNVVDGAVTSANFGAYSATPLSGFGAPIAAVVDNIIRPNAEAQTEYFNLDGKFKATDRLTFKGQIGYTHGLGYTPTEPAFEVDEASTGAVYAPSGNGYAVSFPGVNGGAAQNPQSSAGLANDWAWNERFQSVDSEFYGKIDGDWRIDEGIWKDVSFGVRVADHKRQVDGWDRGCSLGGTPSNCWGAPATPFSAVNPTPYPSGYNASALGIPGLLIPIAGNPNSVISLIDGITNPLRGPISHVVDPQNQAGCTASCAGANYYWTGSFKVQETDYAGYAMARMAGDRWRANIGVRLVDTDENAWVNQADTVPGPLVDNNCGGASIPACTGTNPADILSSAFGPYYVDHVDHNYFDALPSLNFTYDIKPDLLFRFSAAKAMSRPDYSALGGTVSLTDANSTGNGGNANLKPVRSTNYDGTLEWYYGKLSLLSADVFYMDLQSYVSYGTNLQTFYSEYYHAAHTYSVSSPFNIGGGIRGFELAWQTPIAYGFGVLANYTYADGEDAQGHPLVGDSKDTFNVTGYYENRWLSARLAYTYRTHYFVGLDRSSAENEDNTESLDAAVNVTVTPHVTLTLQGLNLTNSLLKYYAANPAEVRAVYDNGTQAYFGVRFKY